MFSIEAPGANKVLLAGDFTDWEARARGMRRPSPKGRAFSASVTLPPGTYEYKFIVDGQWVADPRAESVANCFGTENSVLRIGG